MAKFRNVGTVYLLHFSRPLKHARHYIGFSLRDQLGDRLKEHREGRGARIMEVIAELGIDFELVRTWAGDRRFERRLKDRHSATRLRPICSPDALRKAAEEKGVADA